MNSFILNITASSGEFYQGSCESMVLPVKDGVYGVQAGHSPVLVAIHMGMLKFTVDGETREILVGDGIAEVTPTFVLLLVDSGPRTSTRTVPRPPASAPKSACSTSRVCTSTIRRRSPSTVPCSGCRPHPNTSVKTPFEHKRYFSNFSKAEGLPFPHLRRGGLFFLRPSLDSGAAK